MPVERYDMGDAGEPAVVEGVQGEWRVDLGLMELPRADLIGYAQSLLSPRSYR